MEPHSEFLTDNLEKLNTEPLNDAQKESINDHRLAKAREKIVDLQERRGYLLHELNLISLIPVLNEGILSIAQSKRKDSNRSVKRLIPTGFSPVFQENNKAEQYISVHDQGLMSGQDWLNQIHHIFGIGMLISPRVLAIPGKNFQYAGYQSEALVSQINPNDIIGMIVPDEVMNMSLQGLLYFYIDNKSHHGKQQGSRGIDNLLWATRAILIESARIKDDPSVKSDLSQDAIMKHSSSFDSIGFTDTEERELEKRLPVLKTARILAGDLQFQQELIRKAKLELSYLSEVEERARRLEQDIMKDRSKYPDLPKWNREAYESSLRQHVDKYLKLKEQGWEEHHRKNIDAAEERLAMIGPEFVKVVSRIFKLFIDGYFKEDTRNWLISDYIKNIAERYAIPLYDSSRLNVIWPEDS